MHKITIPFLYIPDINDQDWSKVTALVGDSYNINKFVAHLAARSIVECANHWLNLVLSDISDSCSNNIEKIHALMSKLKKPTLRERP